MSLIGSKIDFKGEPYFWIGMIFRYYPQVHFYINFWNQIHEKKFRDPKKNFIFEGRFLIDRISTFEISDFILITQLKFLRMISSYWTQNYLLIVCDKKFVVWKVGDKAQFSQTVLGENVPLSKLIFTF